MFLELERREGVFPSSPDLLLNRSRTLPHQRSATTPPVGQRAKRGEGGWSVWLSPLSGLSYRKSAAGLHSKVLLVDGMQSAQGKSATQTRTFGRCVGSRGLFLSFLPPCLPSVHARSRVLRGGGAVPAQGGVQWWRELGVQTCLELWLRREIQLFNRNTALCEPDSTGYLG